MSKIKTGGLDQYGILQMFNGIGGENTSPVHILSLLPTIYYTAIVIIFCPSVCDTGQFRLS